MLLSQMDQFSEGPHTNILCTKMVAWQSVGVWSHLAIHVLTVCIVDLAFLQRSKVEEVRRSVDLMVELLWVGQLKVVLHVGVMANT